MTRLFRCSFGRAQPANGRCIPLQPTISLHRTPLSHLLARRFLLRGGNARNPKLLWSTELHVLAVSAGLRFLAITYPESYAARQSDTHPPSARQSWTHPQVRTPERSQSGCGG